MFAASLIEYEWYEIDQTISEYRRNDTFLKDSSIFSPCIYAKYDEYSLTKVLFIICSSNPGIYALKWGRRCIYQEQLGGVWPPRPLCIISLTPSYKGVRQNTAYICFGGTSHINCEINKNLRKFKSFQLGYFGSLEHGILK